MPSLKYLIVNSERVKQTKLDIANHSRLKSAAERKGQKIPALNGPTDNTLQQYITHAVRYGEWCKKTYAARTVEECAGHIQDYADHLVAKGLSASTIHTYLAGVCFVWDVPLDSIQKPIRYTSEFTRSRGKKEADTRRDTQREASPRLCAFQEATGIRRNECLRLRQDCLVRDESGKLCIEVRRGKGGKRQLQRIREGYEELISSYFDGSNDFVFSAEEMRNKIDLHGIRHDNALLAYEFYVNKLNSEPGYRAELEQEIQARWKLYNSRPFDKRLLRGSYYLRGKNRELAQKYGVQVCFDNLALTAVSVYHLAHWRNGVTVVSYILPALIARAVAEES